MRMESEHDAQPGDSQTADGEVLPAPDPTDVSSKTLARDYAAGDTIGGRFEVDRGARERRLLEGLPGA